MTNNLNFTDYFSSKQILDDHGNLKFCICSLFPEPGTKKPIEAQKKRNNAGDAFYYEWECPDCGFKLIASCKPNCKFMLKAKLVEEISKVYDISEARQYFTELGLRVTIEDIKKHHKPSSEFNDQSPLTQVPVKKTKKQELPMKRERDAEEEEEDNRGGRLNKKVKLENSNSDKLIEITEHVKVIKEVTEVQKEEIKSMLKSIKTLNTTMVEMMTRVTGLLEESNSKLGIISTPKSTREQEDSEQRQREEEEAQQEMLTQEYEEILAEFNIDDSSSNNDTPPLQLPVAHTSTWRSKQSSKGSSKQKKF